MAKDKQQQGRLSLAVQAMQTGQTASVRQAAKLYDIPESSLRYHLRSSLQYSKFPRTTGKLTKPEEKTLVRWIINMDVRGMPPRPVTVQDMANLLLSQRNPATTPHSVGKNWVYKFIRRYPEHKTHYTRRHNHQRALCEDPDMIQRWFNDVQKTIEKYGIVKEDI